ncbi:hypothetical protein [Sphingobacterium daejeonense]|uniref:hypothetical protein n=1 Tax=Sphingobacterium daejeonense TaxID=371142 RepID=UPI003D319D4B
MDILINNFNIFYFIAALSVVFKMVILTRNTISKDWEALKANSLILLIMLFIISIITYYIEVYR